MMDAITILINNIPVALQDNQNIVNQLKTDDDFLLDYVCRAVQCQRIPFCSIEDLPTLTITRFTDSTIANIPGPSSADSTKATQPLYTASSNVIDHGSLINNQPSS
ncbi:unnamed protein product [Ceutorhynchus assimilis]|uniref:Uncharacterized protein n=1 Tax=Ceutorhynchus assimilis TaxID=467358 RepID=A0A9N9QM91_9CUCU|nr:unnamed protein product [Ceutorhynchus assimilis]